MKVLLLQLPVPNNKLSNLPLALGYLKASADAARLPGLQVEIMERVAQDRGGDAYLLDAILERDPDIIGFSLYTWNSSRALRFAREIKKVAPEILTLAGGPEVNRDGDFVLAAGNALDFLVLGEGERTFVELLRALNNNKLSPKRSFPITSQTFSTSSPFVSLSPQSSVLTPYPIPGLAYHAPDTGEWTFNLPRTAIEDVNLLPSVYLDGALEGFLENFMMIELSRWCPSKCTFCYYGRQDLPLGGKRYFDIERLRQELEFGMEHGVEQVHFVEANFNTLPHLNQIYEVIKDSGANRKMRFYAEMRAEAIDEAEADKLAECNFSIVECGLQSAVPEVLSKVRRKNHLPRLVRGVQLLRERSIEVFLDAILGLPGDTPETFERTLSFIEENNLAPYDLFHLQILPGTQLKAEIQAGQHGIIYQPAPPYFALQTAELSFEQICELRHQTLLRKGDDPAQIQGVPLPAEFSLVVNTHASDNNFSPTINIRPSTTLPNSQLATRNFVPSNNQQLTTNNSAFSDNRQSIERLVLDRAALDDTANLREIARKLASEVTLWIKPGNLDKAGLEAAEKALDVLSEPNPSGVWHIFVDCERPLRREERARLAKAVRHEAGYIDNLAVFALQERDPNCFLEWPSVGFYQVIEWQPDYRDLAGSKTVWRLNLAEGASVEQWREQLQEIVQTKSYGLHLGFPVGTSLAKARALLESFETQDKTLFLADVELAAGFAAVQSEEMPNLSFPVTLVLESKAKHIQQFSSAELQRFALRWTLARRRD